MEGLDLNALRAANEKEAKPEPTRDEKIATLRERIAFLEAEALKPTPAQEFQRLSEAEQQCIVNDLNTALPEDERYASVAQYATELEGEGVNINDIRLTVARTELAALEAGE